MYETPNKILEASRELNLGSEAFGQVGPGRWESVLKSIFEKFANTSETGVTWLWTNLKDQGVSFQTENGLNYIDSLFEPETNVWVFLKIGTEQKRTAIIGCLKENMVQQ